MVVLPPLLHPHLRDGGLWGPRAPARLAYRGVKAITYITYKFLVFFLVTFLSGPWAFLFTYR